MCQPIVHKHSDQYEILESDHLYRYKEFWSSFEITNLFIVACWPHVAFQLTWRSRSLTDEYFDF